MDSQTSIMKHSLDIDFFSRENEKSWYWAGFAAADGCLSKNLRRLDFCLHPKDIAHLIKLSKDISYTKEPHIYSYNRSYTSKTPGKRANLQIDSKRFCSHLYRFNIVPAKSLIYIPPDINDQEMERHFWRGVCDGDGWLSIQDKLLTIGMCGTKAVCDKFRDLAALRCDVLYAKVSFSDGIYRVKYRGSTAVKIADWLYSNCNRFLDRKMMIAHKFIRSQDEASCLRT